MKPMQGPVLLELWAWEFTTLPGISILITSLYLIFNHTFFPSYLFAAALTKNSVKVKVRKRGTYTLHPSPDLELRFKIEGLCNQHGEVKSEYY